MSGKISDQCVSIFQDRTKSAIIYHSNQLNVQHKVLVFFAFKAFRIRHSSPVEVVNNGLFGLQPVLGIHPDQHALAIIIIN